MNFINHTEMAAFCEGFAKTEITTSTSGAVKTTTIYGGTPTLSAPAQTTDSRDVWRIRRVVVTENDSTTTVVTTWAQGSWTNRASLTYKYL